MLNILLGIPNNIDNTRVSNEFTNCWFNNYNSIFNNTDFNQYP